MKWICVISLVGLLLANCLQAFAWDGDWTNAWSGEVGLFDDPESSQGKSGFDPPQKYYTPTPNKYADVDPEELDDYFKRYKKEYAPYALARVTQNIRYNNLMLPKGYYLIKAGDATDGSPNVNLKTLDETPRHNQENANPTLLPLAGELPAVDTDTIYAPAAKKDAFPDSKSTPAQPDEPPYVVFIIKKMGKVVAVVPIHRMETYKPKRKEHIPRHSLAWIETENRHPVLKFYYHRHIYSTDFQ